MQPAPIQPARSRRWTLSRLRRTSQIVFLVLFLILLVKTEYSGSLHPAQADIHIPYPVRLFLEADPLVAISNALATHALYRGLLWSLVILLPTLFLGRFFCGWICPLGTISHFLGNIKSANKRGHRLLESNRYKRWQTFKYHLLIALLASALFGSAIVGIFDPISLTVRSLGLSIFPGVNYSINGLIGPLGQSPAHWVRFAGTAIHFIFEHLVLSFRQPYFRQGFFLGLIFIAILALNFRITRFWCRALCPLGALLGAVSRWSILGLEKHPSRCEDCNRCLLHCQGGDDPIPGAVWRKAECHLCMNCVDECPENGLRFTFFPETAATVDGPNLKRRAALTSLAAGVAMIPLLRSNTGFAVERHERLIRPPGALDEGRFLARCIRCGECMKVCPNNALQPTFTEAGIEGIWTPVVAPRIGYCEPSCTLCGQVCPTGSIWEFSSKTKAWAAGSDTKPIRIGTAFYDRGRCLPWAMATECIVCEEWCPTSPKAVYLRAAEVFDSSGSAKQVRQPYIDPEHCVGCGACEFACPVPDRAAVYVTSVGESRSKANQILLRRSAKTASYFPESNDVAGWTRSGDVRVFAAADLWKYVDGDAERYLQAGVRQTQTANYLYQGSIEAAADVHRMADPAGAAKIFDSEPPAGSRTIPLGDAGHSYGQSLTFRKGPFFVRLTAFQDSSGVEVALVNLARGIEARLQTVIH